MTVQQIDGLIKSIKNDDLYTGFGGICWHIEHGYFTELDKTLMLGELDERLRIIEGFNDAGSSHCWPPDEDGKVERLRFLEQWKLELIATNDVHDSYTPSTPGGPE